MLLLEKKLSYMDKITVMKNPIEILQTIKKKKDNRYITKIDKNDIFNEKNVNRENEEYNYKLKRDREIANNKWEDEKVQREKTLSEKEEKANSEKESLQNKLDQAYNQIKEMATKTVEATGGVKILGNNSNETNK